MEDFTLFIEKDISDKKYIVFFKFIVLVVNGATTVTNKELISFLTRILVKQRAV